VTDTSQRFVRDRLTGVAYLLLAWFAYLQASPGLVAGHLRDELDLDYSWVGVHVAAFAGGSLVGGFLGARAERALGRRALIWWAVGVMCLGAVGLTVGRVPVATAGSVLVMGLGGGALLATIQATLADHHGERRTVALAEANVAASVSYLILIGLLSLAAAWGASWRIALLVPVAVALCVWLTNRRLPIEAPAVSSTTPGRLPRHFWIAAVLIFCTTSAEWGVNAWGATFVQDVDHVSADTAVTVMAGYFAGVVGGRVAGSGLARRHDPARVLAVAMAVAFGGFAVLWSAADPAQSLVGLVALGLGLGNLFPMAVALIVDLEPRLAALASGRAVVASSVAVLSVPLLVGRLADSTSLRVALLVVPIALVAGGLALTVVVRRRSGRAGVVDRPTRPRR